MRGACEGPGRAASQTCGQKRGVKALAGQTSGREDVTVGPVRGEWRNRQRSWFALDDRGEIPEPGQRKSVSRRQDTDELSGARHFRWGDVQSRHAPDKVS